jgi:hypothetical protein
MSASRTRRFLRAAGIAPTRHLSTDATTLNATCSVRAVIVNRTSSLPPRSFQLRRTPRFDELPRQRAGPLK